MGDTRRKAKTEVKMKKAIGFLIVAILATGFYTESIEARSLGARSGALHVERNQTSSQLDDFSSSMSLLGAISLPSTPYAIAVDGDYAYVACDIDGLLIYDISDPTNITLADQVTAINGTNLTGSYDVVVSDGYAYVADFEGLFIVDVSDPTNASLTGSLLSGFAYYGVDVSPGYAYVTIAPGTLWVIDVSNPASPSMVGNLTLPEANPEAIVYQDGYVYIGDGATGVVIVDVSTPSSPTQAATVSIGGATPTDLAVSGNNLIVLAVTSAGFIDVTDPASPVLIEARIYSDVYSVKLQGNTWSWVGNSPSNSYIEMQTVADWLVTPGSYQIVGGYYFSDGQPTLDIAFDGLNQVVITNNALKVIDASDAWGDIIENYTVTINSIDESAFPEITVNVGVQDESMADVSGLSMSDFSLSEDATGETLTSSIEQMDGSYNLVYTTTNTAMDGASRAVEVSVEDGVGMGTGSGTYTAPSTEAYTVTISQIYSEELFPFIGVRVLVQDSEMNGVLNLTFEDFSISEDEVIQTIGEFGEVGEGSYDFLYLTTNSEADGSSRTLVVSVDDGVGMGSTSDTYTATVPSPTLTIGDEDGVIGYGVDVPVTVENFSNISVLELYVDFDITKLDYTGMMSEYLVDPVFNAVDGMFVLSWYSVEPLELMDGDTLFTIQFDLLAEGLVHEESTPLTWGEGSYIADFDAVVLENTSYIPGSVTGIGSANISGALAYYSSEIALYGATVNLTGDAELSVMSDEGGLFLFEDVLPGDYVVSVELFDEDHPGVNTLDAYRIQLSLDGLNPFTSGYVMFASDVDLSETVNTMDAFKIQRVVVGLDEGFEGGDWGFISSDYEMTTDNWATADQTRSVSLYGMDVIDQDFFGVRFGDANGTWPSSFLDPPESELDELIGNMMLSEAVVGPGGTATVQLRAQDLMELGVIEWHIEFDPTVVTLQDFDLPELGRAVTSMTDSTLSVSWLNISSPMNCDNRTLGTFEFQAVDEDYVYSDLHLYNVVLGDPQGQQLWTEVTDGSVTVNSEAAVNFDGDIISEWALHPVYPNPFNAYTTLSFDVKDAGKVKINVYNILGDLVTTLVDGSLPTGRYTSTVDANSWASGTYFVVMKTSKFSKIQKMVLLK